MELRKENLNGKELRDRDVFAHGNMVWIMTHALQDASVAAGQSQQIAKTILVSYALSTARYLLGESAITSDLPFDQDVRTSRRNLSGIMSMLAPKTIKFLAYIAVKRQR